MNSFPMQRKVRDVINESPEVSSSESIERPVAHKRGRPKKDWKPKESSHKTPHPKRRRGRCPKHRGRNLATNQHGNRESHAEPTASHINTGVAMDQHSATGSSHGDHPQCHHLSLNNTINSAKQLHEKWRSSNAICCL